FAIDLIGGGLVSAIRISAITVQCFGQRLIELSRLRGGVASAFWLRPRRNAKRRAWPCAPLRRAIVKFAPLAGSRHRALRHDLDEVGTVIGCTVKVAHQAAGGDFHGIERAR